MRSSLIRLIIAALITLALGLYALGQETNDPVKVEIWKRFVENRATHQDRSYQAARDYLQKYGDDKDKYTEYLQKWVMYYELDLKRKLPLLIKQKQFDEAFRVGAQILAFDPNYLRAKIDLGYAGYLAASNNNETHNVEALYLSRSAIEQLENGETPTEWLPFKGQDDTLAHLYFAIGFLTLKTNQEESIDSLIKATQYESDIQKDSSTYYLLAEAYESGPYETMSTAYRVAYAGKEETAESKAALEAINVWIDRIIDAYARAIALAGTDPKIKQEREDSLNAMATYYKFRHNGSDLGMTEFIASVLTTPLPSKP